MKLLKIPLLTVALATITSPVSAIFYQARKYEHAETGNQVILFSDVHGDFSPHDIITRIQLHDILSAAKKLDALIIAEDKDEFTGPIPHDLTVAIIGAVEMSILTAEARLLKGKLSKKDIFACSAISFSSLILIHLHRSYIQWQLSTKPSISFKEYCSEVRNKYSEATLLNFKSGPTPLSNLVKQARIHGVPAVNIDVRNKGIEDIKPHLLLSLIYPILRFDSWLMRKITGSIALYPITIKDYYHNQTMMLNEIAAYKDGQLLKEFYDHCVRAYHETYITQELHSFMQTDSQCSLSNFVSKIAKKLDKERASVRDAFRMHDAYLLDAHALHEIYKNRSKKVVFVCVGGGHADNIGPVLEYMGYKTLGNYGISWTSFTQLSPDGTIQAKNLESMALDVNAIFA